MKLATFVPMFRAGVTLNIILDPLLIFGWGGFPELGIAGAAWASVIAYGATFLVGLLIFFRGKSYVRLRWRGEEPVRAANMWKIMRIGFPSGLHSGWKMLSSGPPASRSAATRSPPYPLRVPPRPGGRPRLYHL